MTRFYRHTFTLGVAGALFAAPLALVAQGAHALPAASTVAKDVTPTFAKDVVPIFQAKCQVCHQPNSIAPMSLISYDDAKKYAGKIKARVVARVMPPWHLDKNVGIQSFKNDRSLTDAQIETIAKWVDAGAPMGDPKDMPAAVKFPDPNSWQLAEKFGPPDLIVTSKAFTVPAKGEDKWFRPLVETGITEPRWVRAIEVRPSFPNGRKVVHHALAYLLQDEKGVTGLASTAMDMNMGPGLFMEWAVGKTGQIFPGDAGKLMLPGSRIKWEIHVHSNGEEAKDNTVQLAVYFYPKGFVPQHRTVLKMFDVTRGSELDIPPNEKSITQNFYVMQAPSRIENFQPHMHMRGKAMSMEAIYPDGRREVLSSVNNFQWKWHNNYVYSDSAAPLLPKGTTLVFTAWHDNTASNPNNPDPTQWVGWGDRTVDEMAHCWIDVTYMDQADFDKAVAARKTAKMAGMTMPEKNQ